MPFTYYSPCRISRSLDLGQTNYLPLCGQLCGRRPSVRSSHTADGSIIVIDGRRTDAATGAAGGMRAILSVKKRVTKARQRRRPRGGFLRWENRLASLGRDGQIRIWEDRLPESQFRISLGQTACLKSELVCNMP